jgi:hypothetical protein
MSCRLAVAAVAACISWLAHGACSADDQPPTLTDADVEALVSKAPNPAASIDAWEARRPALVSWLRSRLGESAAKQPAWAVSGEVLNREEGSWHALRCGEAACGWLVVPAAHVGRGPAAVYLADGCMPLGEERTVKENAEPARLTCAELARAGYVVMLMHEATKGDQSEKRPATWQATTHADLQGLEFLRARREVDPDRIAVLGAGRAARRAWWAAALDDRLAAVGSLGTPESGTLEDQVLISLIAPRPHRLALDAAAVREREPAYRHWVVGPQDVYEWCEVSRLFSTRLGTGFSSEPDSPAWRDTLTWLKDEL